MEMLQKGCIFIYFVFFRQESYQWWNKLGCLFAHGMGGGGGGGV